MEEPPQKWWQIQANLLSLASCLFFAHLSRLQLAHLRPREVKQ